MVLSAGLPTCPPARAGAQGTVQQLANGDLLRPLRVECWDYDRAGGHDFIGGCSASIADMQVCTFRKGDVRSEVEHCGLMGFK